MVKPSRGNPWVQGCGSQYMRSCLPREGVMSGDVIELLIYRQPGVKPSLTLRPFGVPGYVAGHSLTKRTKERVFIIFLSLLLLSSSYPPRFRFLVAVLRVCRLGVVTW